MVQHLSEADKIPVGVLRRAGVRWFVAAIAATVLCGIGLVATAQDDDKKGSGKMAADAEDGDSGDSGDDSGEGEGELGEPAVDTNPDETTAGKMGEGRDPRRVMWRIRAKDTARAGQMRDALIKVLASSRDEHLIGASPEDFAKALQSGPRNLPDCLKGAAPCQNPRAALMGTLGADLFVVADLTATKDTWVLSVALYDPTGREAFADELKAPRKGKTADSLEVLALATARDIFNATGTLEITSDPKGATVVVNGLELGTTPLKLEVPAGANVVEVLLDKYQGEPQNVTVNAGRLHPLEFALKPKMALLLVDTAPIEGEVYIDNVKKGVTGEQIELLPGNYELEVRAPSHKPRLASLELKPDERKVMSLTLESIRPRLNVTKLGDVETGAIVARRLWVRAAYRYTSVASGLSESKGTLGGAEVELIDLTEDNEVAPVRPVFGYHGLHLDAGYSWENWGVLLLGLSILSSGDEADGSLQVGDQVRPVELTEFSRFEVKPLQVTYRYPYKNLVPAAVAGFGYARTSFSGETEVGDLELRREDYYFHVSIEASYWFAPWWFGYTSAGIQRELTHDDSDTQLLLGFGVGMAFESPIDEIFAGADPPKTQ